MTRLSISMKNDVVKVLENVSETRGKTISSILSEAAGLYIEASSVGLRTEDVTRAVKIIEIMRDMSAIPIPTILLENMIKLSKRSSEERLINGWFDRGIVLGNILKTYAKDFREFVSFIKNFRFLIPVDMLDIDLDGKNAQIVLSGVGNSLLAARCTSEGIRGLLCAYGYEVNQAEISEGFIKMSVKEGSGKGSGVTGLSLNTMKSGA